MTRTLLTMILALGLATPALAIEQSAQTKIDTSGQAAASAMQSQNDTTLRDAQNALNVLKAQVNALKTCNQNSQLWTGSGCQGVAIDGYTVLPPIVVHNTPTFSGTFIANDDYFGAWKYCSCQPADSVPVITIQGTHMTIQPKSCTSYQQMLYDSQDNHNCCHWQQYSPTC